MRMLREREGVSGWFPFPPHPPFGHLLPQGRRFCLAFLEQWILQLRVNPACRMKWGWGESGRRTVYLSIPLPKGTKRSALVQYSAHESIKTHCWWYQSIISACSVNSYFKQHQHQYADNKINAQSINSQCTEHLQAIHKASASNECKINISALSININAESSNIQWAEHHHAKHSVFISKADSDSVQCTLCQQPLNATLTSMRSSSTSMLRVSTASVQNLNNQRTQFQQPMNTTSMHRASTINVFCINSQCT